MFYLTLFLNYYLLKLRNQANLIEITSDDNDLGMMVRSSLKIVPF